MLISTRDRRTAWILRARLRAMRWYTEAIRTEPMGFVPVPLAARMLGQSTQRVRLLIEDGRLRAVRAFPGGEEEPWLVAVASLLDAPTPLETGRRKSLPESTESIYRVVTGPIRSGPDKIFRKKSRPR